MQRDADQGGASLLPGPASEVKRWVGLEETRTLDQARRRSKRSAPRGDVLVSAACSLQGHDLDDTTIDLGGLGMAHSVRRHLRLEIAEYDATIRRFIPGYEEMLSVAASAVASVDPALVVDLGAGTGGLSEAILDRPQVGRVEVLDPLARDWDANLRRAAEALARSFEDAGSATLDAERR